jgi:hypothetical protein
MHGIADIVVWAVEQYWKRDKVNYSDAGGSVEKLLSCLVLNPDDSCAKAWSAVIVHALRSDHAMLDELRVALLAAEDGALRQPPEALLRALGFVIENGNEQPWHIERQPRSVASLTTLRRTLRQEFLNHQSRAEICLGLSGTKVSRLHMSALEVCRLSDMLEGPILVSACRYDSIVDTALGEFSNQAVRGRRMKRLEDDAQVYAYFGSSLEDCLVVSVLDALNAAGKYLGIPKCCRMSFKKSWEDSCQKHDGDVAFTLFANLWAAAKSSSVALPWQCNPYGMYQGGGMLWHFPCSTDCRQTIELVDSRFEALRRIDSSFADESRHFQTRPFWLREDRRFTFVEPSGKTLKVLPQL